MPKRKRDGVENDASEVLSAHLSRQGHANHRGRPDEKVHHGRKVLHRALKVAKGFERQKLGRRRKTAVQKKDDEDIARLDAEIQALKTLDLNAVAEVHLNKTLLKEKAISSSPLLPSNVVADNKVAQDPATVNVTARLFNSNPIKEAMAEVLPPIRLSLGIKTDANPAREGKKTNLRSLKEPEKTVADRYGDSDGSRESFSDSEGRLAKFKARLGDSENDSGEDDEDFASLDGRIASESEESQHSDVETPLVSGSSGQRVSHPAIDLSISPSPSPSPSPPPGSKGKAPRKEPRAKATTTFLPSLTMGGYWSGSESGSDPEQDIEELAPRKNRRGQRARQQIWEKKFGRGAKHLQKGSGAQQGSGRKARDQGWDPKRGAQMEGDSTRKKGHQPRWKQRQGTGGRNGNIASGGNMTKLAKRPVSAGAQDAKTLHPSWEAAKKAKEQRQTGSFEGKKLVFD